MRTLTLITAVVAIGTSSAVAQLPGDLDITFSTDGFVTTEIQPPSWDNAMCMALQPDGRILVAGTSTPPQIGGSYVLALARYMPDGTLDPSFDSDGKVTTAIGTMDDALYAIAIQQDGKIVVGGSSFENGSGYLFLVARYNADGSLDSSFNGVGWRIDDIGVGPEDRIFSIALQADEKIVVAGRASSGTHEDMALARYNPDGSLDNTFSGDGIIVSSVGSGNDEAYGMVVQPNGRIVIAGFSGDGTDDDFTLARFDADGALDPSFDSDGIVTTSFGPGIDRAFSIALQPDGRIVAGGMASNGPEINFALVRYGTDGDLDLTFSDDGKTINGFSALCFARSPALMPDGRITIGGTSGYGFMVALYNADGTPDISFSGDGVQSTSIEDSYGNAVAVQTDGKILLAGTANFPSDLNHFAVVRYITSLNIDVLELGGTHQAPLIYPNPIGLNTTLEYELRSSERITIRLEDLEGRTVKTYLNGTVQAAGPQRVALELSDAIAPGTYLLTISSAQGSASVQVVKELDRVG